MRIHNPLKLSKSKFYEWVFILPWIVIFTIFSVVMQPDIVKLRIGISPELLLFVFVACNLALLSFIVSGHNAKYLGSHDLLIIVLFLLQFTLFFKNYAISGVLRNTWLIYALLFYFMGRSVGYNSFFKISYFIKGLIISAIIHVLASLLLKFAFLSGNVNFILVGADISGFKWQGYFMNRATGFFSSPLTLSGFLLIALMVLTYFILEQKRFYNLYIFILMGFLLTMSRGSFIAFVIFNLVLLFIKPRLIYNKFVSYILFTVSGIMFLVVSKGIVSFDRILSDAALSISYDTRMQNHSDHLEQWVSNPLSLLFGDSTNQLGIDSDFLSYVFNLGLIVSLFYFVLLTYLSVFCRNSAVGTYLSVGFAAKMIDSILSGSSLGPPSSFAAMYLLGFWVSTGYKKQKWGLYEVNKKNVVGKIKSEF